MKTGFEMSEYSTPDCEYMARALRLARNGFYTAHPNPRVGCVLVRDGGIVGEGWHARTGEAHAEVNAIAAAGDAARGATAYVSLEPCSHHGRTGPCTDALIEAGVAEVVAAMPDPSPQVAGDGLRTLEQAGVRVRIGLMSEQAEQLNRGFVSRMVRGRPFVRLKIAASLDGRTAMADGQSQWITGPQARADVQRLRAASGAILTGIGTVLADDPSLTVRDAGLTSLQPMRVIVDSRLRTPPASCMLELPGRTEIFCIDDTRRGALEPAGAGIHKVAAAADGRVDLEAVLARLAEFGINDVLAETGRELSGALLTHGLADELVIYQAPHIMGSETSGMFATPQWLHLSQRLELDIVDVRSIGRDTRITARPQS